ncbi:hypothetical protein IKE79_00755 [Candidatus Saccharibacteria bacterium]|nr:hypothetical protein [Candidatus Saccharibacteria bacterium]
MPINKSNIKPFACRVTRINGTRNKSITSNLARKGLKSRNMVLFLAAILCVAPFIASISSNLAHANIIVPISVETGKSLTLNVSSQSVELSLVPGSDGVFNNNANITLTVGTNNDTGYTMTMMAKDGKTSLTRTTPDLTEDYPTIATLDNQAGGYSTSDFTVNRWGYRPTNGIYASNNYLPIPSSATNIAFNDNDGGYGNGINNESTTINFGIKLNNSVTAGTYETELIFAVVANNIPTCATAGCTIEYDGNMPSNELANSAGMDNQTIAANTNSTMLWPSNFKRTNYGFAGWNTKSDGTGKNYGPMETIDTTELTYKGMKLYANWIQSAGDMQGWSGCGSLSINEVTALKDTRDNNVYAVAKLVDGKCWMIENLRLGNKKVDGVTNTETLSSSNTDVPQDWAGMILDDGTTGATHLSATSTDWCSSASEACYDQSKLDTTNTTATVSNMSSDNPSNTVAGHANHNNIYSYGNYYNWYSATVGSGNWNSPFDEVVEYSICPSSWKLPSSKAGTATDDFPALISAIIDNQGYSTRLITVYPNNFIYSGQKPTGDSIPSYLGERGYYWSSTAGYINYYSYRMGYDVYNVGVGALNQRNLGYSIRCLASS